MYHVYPENAPPPRPRRPPRPSCLLMIAMERRACERKFDEWLLTDSKTMKSKVRNVNNLIVDGNGLPGLNKERGVRF